METEISFPRGGVSSSKAPVKRFARDEGLFDRADQAENVKHRHKKHKAKKNVEEEEEDSSESVVIETLTNRTIKSGLIVLGCVKSVRTYSILFGLPGGVVGTVPITNMPDSYIEVLKEFAERPDSEHEEILTLGSMFQVGDCFPVKVMSSKLLEGTSSFNIVLSLNPKEINQDIKSSIIYNNMMLVGAVSSIEDHGCVIDLGIHGLTGFINSANLIKECAVVGKLVTVYVKQPQLEEDILESRTVSLTMKPPSTKKAFASALEFKNLNNIIPGESLPVTVTKVTPFGLVVRVKDYDGCIWKDNLKHVFDTVEDYSLGQELKAVVLYKNPVFQNIHFSLIRKLNPSILKKRFEPLKIGDVVKGEILEVYPNMVYIKLAENIKGLSRGSQLSDQDIENAKDVFDVGSKKTCRIIDFSPMDRLAKVSFQNSIMNEIILSEEDLFVGQVLMCTVIEHKETGMLVQLANRIRGFVQTLHMSDTSMNDPEKLHPIGSKVKCKILEIDGNKKFLTCKKMLVSSQVPPLSSYKKAKEGKIVEGVIVQITEAGLLVVFYNGVKGWVPSKYISESFIEYPKKFFKIGQVVKCKIISCSPKDKHLLLALQLDQPIGTNVVGEPMKLNAGEIRQARVIDIKDTCLVVEILPENHIAVLPIMHLSDHPDICKIIADSYEIGDIIKKVVVFSLSGQITVSRKRSFLCWAQRGKMITSLDQVSETTIVPAVFREYRPYGMFLDLGNNVTGLLRTADSEKMNYAHLQSLIVKVLSIDPMKSYIILAHNLSDWKNETKPFRIPLDHLEHFLHDYTMLAKELSLRVGQVTECVIKKVTSEGLICQLEDDKTIKAFVSNTNSFGLHQEGVKVQGVILHLDLINNCVELSLDKRLVKHWEKHGYNPSQIHVGHVLKAKVLLVKKHFALACFQTPCIYGNLVYLPVQRHPNFSDQWNYICGRMMDVVIFRAMKNFIIGMDYNTVKQNQEANKARKRKLELDHCETFKKRTIKDEQDVPLQMEDSKDHIKVTDNPKPFPESVQKDKEAAPLQTKDEKKLKKQEKDSKQKETHVNDSETESLDPKEVTNNDKNFKQKSVQSKSGDSLILETSEIKESVSSELFETQEGETTKKSKFVKSNPLKTLKRSESEFESSQLSEPKSMDVSKSLESTEPSDNQKSEKTDNTESEAKEMPRLEFDVPFNWDIKDTHVWTKHSMKKPKLPSEEPKPVLKEKLRLILDVPFNWDIDTTPNLVKLIDDNQEISSGDEEEIGELEELQDMSNKQRKKLKELKRKDEEDILRKKEELMMDTKRDPETADDFERLLVASPDNSMLWMRYMAFQLQQAEIEQARAIGERALKSISFREEIEKLNVWVALLNLENLYGTGDSLSSMFQRALQFNEPIDIYRHMVKIYVDSDKNEEAEQIFVTMLKKFRQDKSIPSIWAEFGQFYMKSERKESARKLLDKSLKSLDKRHHIEVITKFARMEFSLGDPERGKTLFKSVLGNYPKRMDLWNVFIDLLIKHGEIDSARQSLEHLSSIKLGVKQMKFVFGKFVQFEKNHGTEESLQNVKTKALEYVETSDIK